MRCAGDMTNRPMRTATADSDHRASIWFGVTNWSRNMKLAVITTITASVIIAVAIGTSSRVSRRSLEPYVPLTMSSRATETPKTIRSWGGTVEYRSTAAAIITPSTNARTTDHRMNSRCIRLDVPRFTAAFSGVSIEVLPMAPPFGASV